jgi:ribose transport system permease protein
MGDGRTRCERVMTAPNCKLPENTKEATAASSIDAAIAGRTHTAFGRLISSQLTWVFLATLFACVFLTFTSNVFATPQNIFNITRNFAFVAIVALGTTAVIITGGIDLSIGSLIGLAGMVVAVVMQAGYSVWLAVPAGFAAVLFAGLINGVLIAYANMPPFVVTLGMMSIARGAVMILSNNKLVYQFGPDQDVLFWLGGGTIFGVANPVIVLIITGLATGFILRWTAWGRYLFAIGGNENAATRAGVPVRRVKVGVYLLSALSAGIVGILQVGWLGAATSGAGVGMELSVIAAAVIGGANLMGGSGTALGAVIGAALIEIIRNSLLLLGVHTFWQGVVIGWAIILAVFLDKLQTLRNSS